MDSMLRSELNSLRDECDRLDYPGTPGRRRLRETCRTELGHFLLYVACGDFFQTREQAALLNTVWEGVHPPVYPAQMEKTLDELGLPSASECETLAAFAKAGKAGRLIRAYAFFGKSMAGLGRGAVSSGRCQRFTEEMQEAAKAGFPEG